MNISRNEIYEMLSIEAVAERLAGFDHIDLLADRDAVAFGDERFQTKHFGHLPIRSAREMVQVHTDSEAGSWMVKVTAADHAYDGEFVFRAGELVRYVEIEGRPQRAKVLPPEAGDAFSHLLEASRAAGLSDFRYEPEQLAPAAL